MKKRENEDKQKNFFFTVIIMNFLLEKKSLQCPNIHTGKKCNKMWYGTSFSLSHHNIMKSNKKRGNILSFQVLHEKFFV